MDNDMSDEKPDDVAQFAPFIQRHLARKGEIPAEEMAALYEDFHGITMKRKFTKSEKVAKLKELGWSRISSGGAQSWRHPILHGQFTLAAAWQQESKRSREA